MHLGGLAYLAHVSFHTGVIDNEGAGALPKKDTSLNVAKTQLPLRKSDIKNFTQLTILLG